MSEQRVKRIVLRILEFAVVAFVAYILYALARKAGVEFRRNELYGGEVCVPPFIFLVWYGGREAVKDIRRFLSDEE